MTGARLHLTLPAHAIEEPVVYELGRRFELVTNIRRANIEEHGGWVILEVDGPEDRIADAVSWLSERGVQVDRIGDEDA